MSFLNSKDLSKLKNLQKGQILLIVVLTMVVALTVGLSVASRIVSELKISKQNEESQRAFQAAEAGIQETLKKQANINVTTFSNNSNFSTVFSPGSQSRTVFVDNGLLVDQTSGSDFWLSLYDPANPANTFTQARSGEAWVYWGEGAQSDCGSTSGPTVKPAIEVALLEGPKASPTIKKYLFDSCGNTRTQGTLDATSNGSPNYAVTDGTSTISFSHRGKIVFNNGLIMKIIPIYNSSKIAIEASTTITPTNNFPVQGSTVESTGKSGDTVRRVKFFRSYPQIPIEVFPYSILSQ